MTERRGSRRRGSAANASASTDGGSNSRPNSGIFNIMWTKMAEYLEMRTFSDWSSDGDEAEQTTASINLENGIHGSLVDDHFNNEPRIKKPKGSDSAIDNSSTHTEDNTHTEVEDNEVFTSTSSANESYDYADSGIDTNESGKSSTSSTFYSYSSSTISSNSSFASFRDEDDGDFDFVDTLTFQEYDDSEYALQEYEQKELGEGHSFVPTRLFHLVTWCDKCGDIIWGFHKQCLRCANCKYTCHFKCYQDGVKLDCSENHNRSGSSLGGYDVSPDFTFVSAKDSALTSLSREELLRRTVEYNIELGRKVMKVEPDEGISFFGPLSVNFNLSRPVSIKSGSPVPTFCNSLKRYDHSVDVSKRRTSFFFPKAQVESLHITSETSAQEVVDCLLKRYKLIDNPHKFALFERTERSNGEVLMRKLEDEDTPLLNVLFWGPNNTEKSMELRENETGIVQWEAFTVPELSNFLRILKKEEEEYIEQVKKKYLQYQEALLAAVKDAERERDATTETGEEVAA